MTVLELGTCFCGQPATRTLGSVAYCDGCYETIVAPIRERVITAEALDGVGVRAPAGRDRPDHGPGFVELACHQCGAGWVGYIGDPCTWCQDALEHMQQWQAEILLRPELPDPGDARYEAAVQAWGERLERGVSVGLVTTQQALAALQRQVRA